MSNLFCTFQVAGALYGVNVLDVKEVNTETAFTPIPHAPPEVRGYVNLRGHVHLVLDLRLLLGMERQELGPDNRLIIFKASVGESFGVLVDSIGDILTVKEEEIEAQQGREQTLQESRQMSDLVTGIGRCEETLLIILDARRLLPLVHRALPG